MKLKSLTKDYKLFANVVVFGSIIIAVIALFFSYKSFSEDSEQSIKANSNKINQQITESLSYIENITNLISNQILEKNNTKKETVASILINTRSKIDESSQNIFTWTLFDFVDHNGYVIASSVHGILAKPILITKERRSWIIDAKITPGKLLSSKADIGIISGEPVIPFGFGVVKKDGSFVGTVSFGLNIKKFKRKLESVVATTYITFAILDKYNSIIFASENFNKEDFFSASKNTGNLNLEQGFLEFGGNKFYYQSNENYPLSILVGVDQKIFLSQFQENFLPKILNTIYLTTFFLILLYFFRTKLLNPVVTLSESANKIAQGNTKIIVPQSDIAEVNFLSRSIETVRCFVEKQQEEKNFAETANHNKTEFLASTAHELKNIVAGIIGLAELVKMNFSDKSNSVDKTFSDEEIIENQNFLEDVVKLGEELAEFIHDITDVNQSQTGDFKIEEQSLVDVKDVALRSIKLLKMRAAKSNKQIITQFLKQRDEDFLVENLDPRRLKQIIVNILSNSIKYANDHSKIKITLERFSSDASKMWRDSMLENVKNNSEIDDRRKSHLLTIIKKSRPKISIIVKDEGVGMTDEEIVVALAKYGRLENEAKIDSTGLGLPLVKHLVELQGGVLMISSQKNIGTEVKIIF